MVEGFGLKVDEMNKNFAFLFIFVFILAGCTGIGGGGRAAATRTDSVQAIVCPGVADDETGRVAFGVDWFQAAGMALMASTIILVIIYLFGTTFGSMPMKNFSKLEFTELIVTVLLIIAIKIAMTAACSITVGDLIQTTRVDHSLGIFQATEEYFTEASNKIIGWTSMNYVLNVWVDQMASVTPYSRPLGVGLVATPLAGFASPIKQMIYNVTIGLAVAFVINSAQLYVFQFAVFGFLKYYLPIGVFLRSFTPTRRIGGTVIALGLSFLLFYPFIIMMTSEIVFGNNSALEGFDSAIRKYAHMGAFHIGNEDKPCEGPTCELDAEGHPLTYGQQLRNQFTFTGFLKKVTVGLFEFMGDAFSFLTGGALTIMFLLPLSTVGMAFALGYLLPAFNTLLLVQTVKYTSKLLGEEIDITALTRLI